MWEQHDSCSGMTVSDQNCDLRIDEMQLINYQPDECATGQTLLCGELQAFARLNIRNKVISDAKGSFFTTIFTCVIMTIGSIMFSSDTEKIIIVPITKMVGIIRMLADDPLQKRE